MGGGLPGMGAGTPDISKMDPKAARRNGKADGWPRWWHTKITRHGTKEMNFQPCTIPVLNTQRLILRGWREDDLDMLTEIFEDEDTARFIGGTKPRWEVWRQMAAYIGHWHLRGFGFWVVEDKKEQAPVGFCGLWAPQSWPENEVGYGLLPRYQGKGFVTEAAIASLRFAYQSLGWRTAISFIDANNLPSEKVVERMGAHRDGRGMLFDKYPANIWRHLSPEKFLERFA